MSSTTEISNLAISHLGIGKEIANLDTEQTEEASACRRYFESAKKATLSDLDWTFATKFAVLNLIESEPNDEWNFSYRYPSDCINMRRILSGQRQDTQKTRVPYRISADSAGRIIYTDKENAEIEYTKNVTDPGLFSAEFALALSFRLASYIAPRLTGGDPFKMKQEMLAQYEIELGRAKKKNMNEETADILPESEMITIRS
jgi:hypothetical protein